MTTLTDNTIDELIKRVKALRPVGDFVFASAYPPREIAYPIGRYTVAVGNTGMRIKRRFVGDRVASDRKGTLYQVMLCLRLYAPVNSAGAALLRASCLLADAVEHADDDRAVQDIAFSGVAYDTAARTLYRDLTLTLVYVLSEEVRDD